LTNAGWSFSIAALREELGLARLLVLNDFAALAWSLPFLEADELRRIGRAGVRGDGDPGPAGDPATRGAAVPGAGPAPDATLAVLGPGTGIGMSGLVRTPAGSWAAISGEGGHASLAPADEREGDILDWVRRHHPHVSIERLVSGSGLPLLHAAVGVVDGYTVDNGGDPGDEDDSALAAANIADRARAGEAHAHATLSTFCAMLGGAAGNLALTLGARGGVYIGGGIAPRIEAFLGASDFRARFEDKGRFSAYLGGIPTWLIDARAPALRGAAHALARSEAG
ncbi:MAG: glucokinase, partial [Burkholderiaceae bacterium]